MYDAIVGYKNAAEYKDTLYDPAKTQDEMCLEYLQKYGWVTPLDALTAFSCFRLSAVIFRLRAEGYAIRTEINEGYKKYAIYVLADESEESNG